MQSQPNGATTFKTDAQRYAHDATRRWPVKNHRGITYRLNRSLERSYLLYHKGQFLPAGATMNEALELQESFRKAKRRGERIVRPTDIPTFATLAEQWYATKAARKRPNTLKCYRAGLDLVLLPRFGGWLVSAIDADACAELIRDLEREGLHAVDPKRPRRPLGRSSILNYLKPLHGILKAAKRKGYIRANPLAELEEDERPAREEGEPYREWTDEEITALLEAAGRHALQPGSKYDYTPLLRLVAQTGIRLGEVLGLRWEDFAKDEGTLHIRRQWTRFGEYAPLKTASSTRKLKLPTDLRDELIALRLRSNFSHDGHPIFASLEGTPLGYRNVTTRGFEPARDLAGLPASVTFHDLRHCCASRLLARNIPVADVAKFLGHKDGSITLKVYGHRHNPDRADDAIAEAVAL